MKPTAVTKDTMNLIEFSSPYSIDDDDECMES